MLYKILRDKERVIDFIENIVSYTVLVRFSNSEVKEAIGLMAEDQGFKDLEDTLVYVLAKKEKCDFILSNDGSFYSPDLLVISSEEICRRMVD